MVLCVRPLHAADCANSHLGISGWRYKGWRGSFYPEDLPHRRELEFAAQHFNTIELNGSFSLSATLRKATNNGMMRRLTIFYSR